MTNRLALFEQMQTNKLTKEQVSERVNKLTKEQVSEKVRNDDIL